MIHEIFYKNIPATRFSQFRRMKSREQVIEDIKNGTFKGKITGRLMTSKTFEIFRNADALDGITTIISNTN